MLTKSVLENRVIFIVLILVVHITLVEASVTRHKVGNDVDVSPSLHGPAWNLGGGGTDVDQAIQWMINEARGCSGCSNKVDVVVLRTTGGDGYNAPILAMNGVDSVETLVITSASDSNQADVENTVRKAEVVFFAGGDQCKYVQIFKGTKVEASVEYVISKGGAVGGTSAGLAIQGPFVYDACSGSINSNDALSNPYNSRIRFTYNFFNWVNFNNILADTHFVARDRMGRLMAFLARQIKDKVTTNALGLAVDEKTSFVIDKNGLAKVLGFGKVYMILADHMPEVAQEGKPLTFSKFKIWKLNANDTYNLRNRPACGYYTRSVNHGKIDTDPYDGVPENCSGPMTNFTISLEENWNLISLPVQPSDANITNVLSGIDGMYSAVHYWNGTFYESYYPESSSNALTDLMVGRGYWIFMKRKANLVVNGNIATRNIALKTGWNLVGHNSVTPMPVSQALNSLTGKVVAIYAYNASSYQYETVEIMKPSEGYWMNLNSDAIWTILL
jgi:cyanophycinase